MTATVIVEKYALAATGGPDAYNYSGLTIHATPGIHEAVADAATQHVKPAGSVLEVAAGSGALCRRLEDRGFSLSACDLVTENFRLHDRVPFTQLDLNTDFVSHFDRCFDAITATEIIEHIENPRHFLRQCRQLLSVGGFVILTTPNIDAAWSRALLIRRGAWAYFDQYDYEKTGHITPVPRWVLHRALTEAGFKLVYEDGIVPFTTTGWWKMRLFAWLLKRAELSKSPQGQSLLIVAQKIENRF